MAQDRLASAIGVSKSLVQSFESGKLVPQEGTAARLDEVFGTGDEIQEAAKDAREDQRPWLRSWREHERRAILLRSWEPLLVPGLLQREAYMRKMFAAVPANAGRIEELVKTRLARQAAVFDREAPATIACIVAEFALRRGPREIMKDQLGYLADVGQQRPVTIRVVPDDAGGLHAGLGGPLAVATMPDGRHIFYLDDQLRGRLATTPSDVSELELSLESINGLALSIEQSRDLILEMLNECK